MEYLLEVENIKCGGCANSIAKLVSRTAVVKDLNIDVETGQITYASDKDVTDSILKALAGAGYPEVGKGNVLHSAKSYVSCAIGRVTKQDDAVK